MIPFHKLHFSFLKSYNNYFLKWINLLLKNCWVTCVILPQNTSCRSPKVLTLAKGLSPYSKTYLRLGGTAADFCTFTLSNNTSRNTKKLHPGRLSKDDLLFHLKRNKHKNLTEFFMTGNSYHTLTLVFSFLNYW